jgi:hypothetical protein
MRKMISSRYLQFKVGYERWEGEEWGTNILQISKFFLSLLQVKLSAYNLKICIQI